MPKEVSQKLKNTCKKFLMNLAGRPLPTFLILFLIVLIVGAILFYQYSIVVQRAEPEIKGEPIQFQENLYQKILKEWQDREEKFKAPSAKEYPNPFQLGARGEGGNGEKKLSQERTQELLASPQIQELLEATNLYQLYIAKGETFLTIDERAEIWQELGLGRQEEYQGTYNQNIRLLSELKKELTPL